jgi:hypothetical protein
MAGTRVCYRDEPGTALTVSLIHQWRRGDITEPVMSASSGPKDYVKNRVYAIFESNPAIDSVSMVRGGGPPFLLLRIGRSYFDMSNREVELKHANIPR